MKRLAPTDQNSTDLSNVKNLSLIAQSGQSHSPGKLIYDSDSDTLTFFNSNSAVAMQLGQEAWIRVVNNTGSTIVNGAAVYINGASSGLPTIGLAKADALATSQVAGIVTASIANGAIGFVTNRGLVRGLDTSAYSAGAPLYLSAATAGLFTATAPAGSNYIVMVANAVTINASTGVIYANSVDPVTLNGPRLNTITSSATPSINVDTTDQYNITALAANITSVAITGTPADGQKLLVRIKGAAAQAISWGSSFQSSGTATLLATTAAGKTHLIGFIYDSAVTKWVCQAVDTAGY